MKITLLKSLLVLGAFLSFGISQAQEVSGTVSDAGGPLPGASVLEKGTTNGTQTDFDGNYSLTVNDGATIIVSYIGYKSQEVSVDSRTSINFTLEEDAEALEEVVIIGYGTTTIKDATGSVAAVTSEDFNGGAISSPEQLIQGKTAGVNIQQTTGEPGAGIQINIRGANSVRANNNPLFVVDGVPLFGESTEASGSNAGGTGSGQTGNPLNFLNPNDIESMSILKDASATAIYGSRGANGVVIITTKTGKAAQKGIWDFSTSLSVATPVRQFDLLNREEFLSALPQYGGDAAANDFGSNTDWQEVIFRSSASTNNNLSYSNNYGSGNVRATFGYQKQFGTIEKSEFERITGRINLNQRFLEDKLLLTFQTSISRVNKSQPPLNSTAGVEGDILGAAYSANPTWPNSTAFQPDGSISRNPINLLVESQNISQTDRLLLNGSAEYKFTPELSAKVNVGLDKSESGNVSVLSAKNINYPGISDNGFGTYYTLDRDNKTLETTINYAKEFENSNFDVIVGYAFQDFRTRGRNAVARGFSTTDLNAMGVDLVNSVNGAQNSIGGSFQQYYYAANTTDLVVNRLFPNSVTDNVPYSFDRNVTALTADTYDNTDELQSLFGRVNYSLNSKYLFTATMRADGSSRFGPENQYGYFPSGAFAWQIGEEDFIGENVSTLKLRLSAGLTGNQAGLGYGNFVARQRFGGLGINNSNEIQANGLAIVATDNPSLKWESTLDFNVGLDFGFNNDRLNGSVDVYRRDTKDLLLKTPPAFPATTPFQFGNVDANVINQGIEFALGYDFIQQEDVNFSANFNISYNDNEIQNFAGAINSGPINGPGLTGAFAQRFESGYSLFSYYMAQFEGFDSTGNPIYTDIDGNGVGDPDVDKTFVGEDALPDITSGLSLNLKVKNWDVATYLTGQFGFSVYNNTANSFFNAGQIGTARNVTNNVLSLGEDPGASTAVSSRFLEKGDFIRLQNVSVGYNVPLSGEGTLRNLRLSLTGQNLFLITDYSGIDPEVTVNTGNLNSAELPTRGIDFMTFPNPLTVTFGINASF
ncbi:SusC/RagA family TonB-linked outer membrane protein [Maribacter arcticus]|uniref:Iron complex outermembrane recepter protein n=1 Tax=Maribacter arcticus TaxID=561365 RepID=A0A1T5A6Q4_9FLAO|nr:SusC/RagA family TonB-linked outer membrane protein [Maribacter arcticus]SKB30353.1 iron complex outermembrane recepter protein [Maribacter arcticus]|tara:strand:- start:667 stop:3798 length:3132 start_codon:yes stop_codon:yes gene_type:complete